MGSSIRYLRAGSFELKKVIIVNIFGYLYATVSLFCNVVCGFFIDRSLHIFIKKVYPYGRTSGEWGVG